MLSMDERFLATYSEVLCLQGCVLPTWMAYLPWESRQRRATIRGSLHCKGSVHERPLNFYNHCFDHQWKEEHTHLLLPLIGAIKMWILLEKQPLAVIFLYHNPVRRISFEKQILSRNLNQPNHYQLPLRRMKLAVWHRRWGARQAVTILSKPWDLYINYKTSWHYSAFPIDSKEGFSFFLK